MKITAVRVTPIAIKDPALLNAAGVHEPFGLRSIIEVVGANAGQCRLADGMMRRTERTRSYQRLI